VAFPPGVLIKDISASSLGGIVALSRTGDIYTWGRLFFSLCTSTISRNVPYKVKPPADGFVFKSVWSSDSGLTMFARGADSRLYWWIQNPYARPSACGNDFQTYYPRPRLLAQPDGVQFGTALGWMALSDAQELYLWGSNDAGQLGNGSKATGSWLATPQALALPGGATPASIERDTQSVFAVTTDGVAFAWGGNNNGSLGVGSSSSTVLVPTRVQMPSTAKVVRIVGGGNGSFLTLTTSGRIFGWGYNQVGVLGGKLQASYSKPRLVG
jgi:alpha-tubulin suppressor-like RCC1 family protein